MTALQLGVAAALVGAGFLAAVGIVAIAAPRYVSKHFGVPLGDGPELVYMRALGFRDIVLAIVLAGLLLAGAYELAVSTCLFLGALGMFDGACVIYACKSHPRLTNIAHIAGGLVFVSIGLVLLHVVHV